VAGTVDVGRPLRLPHSFYLGLAGLAFAAAFVVLVFVHRRLLATLALLASMALLSYPFFAGLTGSGRAQFWFGSLFGLGALILMQARPAGRPVPQ
jgi:hypothetical protein